MCSTLHDDLSVEIDGAFDAAATDQGRITASSLMGFLTGPQKNFPLMEAIDKQVCIRVHMAKIRKEVVSRCVVAHV